MFQQYAVREDGGEFEKRVRPYVDQVRMVDVLSFYLICLVSELNFRSICILEHEQAK